MTKEVMKQALEALKNTTPLGFNMEMDKKFYSAIEDLEEALKQEQGEPVAGYYFPLTNEIMRGSIEALIAHAKRARWTDAIVRKDGVETKYEADWIKKLVPYTTPQTKEWVGLTDDEKEHIEISGGKADLILAEKIEAILKERNT